MQRMKRTMAFFLLLACLAAMPALAANVMLVGVIGDSMCNRAVHNMKGMSDAECVRDCVKAGAQYVLIVNGKSLLLQGNAKQFSQLAAKKVIVKGVLTGNTLQVKSMDPAK